MRIRDFNLKFSRVIVICLIVSVLTGAIVYATSPTQPFTINRGIYPSAPTFSVWEEDGTYFAKNQYGVIAYTGDAATVIQAVFDVDPESVFLTGDINLETYVLVPSNIEIYGDAILTLNVLPASVGGAWGGYAMFINENWEAGGDSDIYIHDLHFMIDPDLIGIGGYTRTVFVGLFMGASNVTIQNCVMEYSSFYFEPSYDWLIAQTGSFDDEFLTTDARNIHFLNNHVYNGVEGCWLHLVDGAWVANNWIETTLDSAFGLHWGGRGYHIIDNTILRLEGDYWTPTNIAGSSIEVTSAKDSYASGYWQEKHVISGNIIRSVNCGYRAEIVFNGYKFRDIIINNNNIEHVHDASLSTGTYNGGVAIQGEDIIVSDNIIKLSTSDSYAGVHVWINNELNGTNIKITGNIITEAEEHGVYVQNEQSAFGIHNVLVSDNIVDATDAGGYSIRTYSSYGVGLFSSVYITNNIVDIAMSIQANSANVTDNVIGGVYTP